MMTLPETLSPPTADELVANYDEYYRSNPTRWDNADRNAYAVGAITRYLGGTKRNVPATWLDVGCGSGHSLVYFQQVWRNCRYYGIDLSPEAVAVAQQRMPGARLQAVTLADARFDTVFDVITILGVLEHFPEPLEGLRQLGSNLAPNGILYIEVPYSISYPTSTKSEGFHRLNSGSQQWEWHLYRSSWEKLIQESGLHMGVALQGPQPSTEFIWILTRAPGQLSRGTIASLRWFELLQRIKGSPRLDTARTRVVTVARQSLGDDRVDAVKKMLGR